MITEVMSAFGYTPEYILWKWSMPQFYLWYDMAIWKNYDYKIRWVKESDNQTAEEINKMFVKNEKTGRWE